MPIIEIPEPGSPLSQGDILRDINSIHVPPRGSERQSFVDCKRIAVLHQDFLRDLHVRLFRAVASLGFDDHRWLSDSDLEWLVDAGKAELLKAQSKAQEMRAKKSSVQAQGGRFEPKELNDAEEAEQALLESLRPFEQENQKRRGQEMSA